MSVNAAYGGEDRKQALIEDIRIGGPVFDQALTGKVLEQGLGDAYLAYDIHPALLRLLATLGGYQQDEETRAFYVKAFEAVPVGANPLDGIRQWFLDVWSHPTHGVGAALVGTTLEQPAKAILDLVRQSTTGTVDKKAWRQARSTLIAALGDDEALKEPADIVLSMAWDLDQNPGAAGDVANAWGGPVMWGAHKADSDQFSEDEDAALMKAIGDFHQQAIASVGEITPGDAAQYAAYQAALQNLWAADPKALALKQRSDAKGGRAQAAYAEWNRSARQALVDRLANAKA